jgi:hypothetical protein
MQTARPLCALTIMEVPGSGAAMDLVDSFGCLPNFCLAMSRLACTLVSAVFVSRAIKPKSWKYEIPDYLLEIFIVPSEQAFDYVAHA